MIKYIYRIQAYVSIICGYFCIGFIDFMLKSKSIISFVVLISLLYFLLMNMKKMIKRY